MLVLHLINPFLLVVLGSTIGSVSPHLVLVRDELLLFALRVAVLLNAGLGARHGCLVGGLVWSIVLLGLL